MQRQKVNLILNSDENNLASVPPEDDFYLCGSTVTVQRWRGGKGIGPVRKPGGKGGHAR